MSVQKAEFRVLQRVTKGGETRVPGDVFVAGVAGVHVKRWLSQGKIAIVKRVPKDRASTTCSNSVRRAAAWPTVPLRKPIDRAARGLGLLILGAVLIVATKLSRAGERAAEPVPPVQLAMSGGAGR